MDIRKYLDLMQFDPKWMEYGLVPLDHLAELMDTYQPGMEEASEHDRNSVFHWWLMRSPPKETLIRLVELSFLDPDQVMASDVRQRIVGSACFDQDVEQSIREGLEQSGSVRGG